MINTWIDDCKTNHLQCVASHRENSWLPTRLLEIESDESGPRSVRLLDTATLSASMRELIRYIALSHMWGDMSTSPPFRTIKANYAAVQEDIDARELPRNFIHAVRVCTKFEISHLWIDSLCIIQDDSEDWGREAGLMHLVYKHAELTIAA
jgi:hypothetical protein